MLLSGFVHGRVLTRMALVTSGRETGSCCYSLECDLDVDGKNRSCAKYIVTREFILCASSARLPSIGSISFISRLLCFSLPSFHSSTGVFRPSVGHQYIPAPSCLVLSLQLLIAPGGSEDRLMADAVEDSWTLAIQEAVRFSGGGVAAEGGVNGASSRRYKARLGCGTVFSQLWKTFS